MNKFRVSKGALALVLTTILIAGLLAALSLNVAAGVNKVTNPGFETGSLSPWTTFGGGSVVNTNQRSGSYCGRTGASNSSLEQIVSGLSPNTTYVLSGYAKVATSGESALIGVKDYGGTETNQSASSTSYQLVSFNFTTGASNTSAKIYCYKYTGTGVAYCDDFVVDTLSSNLALNRPTTVSSTESGSYPGSNAVDGSGSTRWSSAFSDPQWIYVDLGATYSVNRVVLNWEAAYGKSYKIQVSNDASNWTDVYSTTSGNGGIDDLTVSGSGRYVRMYGTQRGTVYGYSLWELEVYGGSGPTSTPTRTNTPTRTPTNTPVPPTNTPVPSNLLSNPGFETGSLSPWSGYGGAAVVNNNQRSGSYSGRTGASVSGLEQVVSGLSPNTTYSVVGYAKVATAGETIVIGVKEFGGTEQQWPTTSSSYQQISFTFTTGASNTSAKIFCYKHAGSGYGYCDDLSLTGGSMTWNLVWSDEFDGTSINTSNWGYELGYVRNNELQYYTSRPENAYVSNGLLVIKAIKESYQGYEYTSASLMSKGKREFTYGKIEARLSIPMGKGLWPAFWTLGGNIDTVGWPQCGEIDIMEHINTETVTYGTAHWNNNGHVSSGTSTTVSNPNAYHIYTIEWDSSAIKWFVDGVQYHTVSILNGVNSTEEFHLPQYIILNLAVGGSWPGAPDGSTTFPAYYYVDYVRVYQR